MDIEPNVPTDQTKGIYFKNCTIAGTRGPCYVIFAHSISVYIENPRTRPCRKSVRPLVVAGNVGDAFNINLHKQDMNWSLTQD